MTLQSTRQWTSYYYFLLAAIGSTVGLSNIWKFTYMVGENGGGAFVLVYLASLVLLGIPVLTAELVIGRMGGRSMVGSLARLSREAGISSLWQYFGWIAMLAVFLVLSFYCVIAGMTIDYTVSGLGGQLHGLDAEGSASHYHDMLSNPMRLALFQGIFVLATTLIVARGVHAGLERSVSWMMPSLFAILLVLALYSAVTGQFMEALTFMFQPDFGKINAQVALNAFGQAFFSLGVGVGVMLTYGAYMPRNIPIVKSAVTISLADGLTAIVAGLAIFPIVFQYQLSPAEGPGLLFVSLPVAFAQMPGGMVVGPLFFVLLVFAALSSSISLLESIISRLEEILPYSRTRITYLSGFLLWFIGLATVFSFNLLAEFTPLDFIKPLREKTLFGIIDYLASNLIMPLGGIFMAIIAGWELSAKRVHEELDLISPPLFAAWRLLIRFIAPVVVLIIFLSNL